MISRCCKILFKTDFNPPFLAGIQRSSQHCNANETCSVAPNSHMRAEFSHTHKTAAQWDSVTQLWPKTDVYSTALWIQYLESFNTHTKSCLWFPIIQVKAAEFNRVPILTFLSHFFSFIVALLTHFVVFTRLAISSLSQSFTKNWGVDWICEVKFRTNEPKLLAAHCQIVKKQQNSYYDLFLSSIIDNDVYVCVIYDSTRPANIPTLYFSQVKKLPIEG